MRLGTDPPLHDGEHEQDYQLDLKQKKVRKPFYHENDKYQYMAQAEVDDEEYFGLKGLVEVVVEEVEEPEVVLVNWVVHYNLDYFQISL